MRRSLTLLAAFALIARIAFATTTHHGVDTDSTQTLSNKTLDRTNTVQSYAQIQIGAAICLGSSPSSLWDTPISDPAVAACVTGTNVQKGVLEFAASSNLSAQMTLEVPQGYSGSAPTDAEVVWESGTTSGDVVWQLATLCTATNASATDDSAFNTASTVTSAAAGTAHRLQSATISSVTMTGCAVGAILHLKLSRNAGSGSDTMSGTARFILLRLKIPKE